MDSEMTSINKQVIGADSHLIIGASHERCEDYAFHSVEKSLAIISDGCSGAPNTDIGSRMLSLFYSKSEWNRLLDDKEFANAITESTIPFGIHKSTLCATLLAVQVKNHQVSFDVRGDGVTFIKFNDGSIRIHERIYPSGAPKYPIYYECQRDLDVYEKNFGDNHTDMFYTITKDGELKINSTENQNEINTETFCINHCEYAGVMSDGITSYVNGQTVMETAEAVKEFMSFKNSSGKFVVRRVKKANKTLHSKGFTNFDDVSMSCLHFGVPKEEQA
jgi:hypothetical protein